MRDINPTRVLFQSLVEAPGMSDLLREESISPHYEERLDTYEKLVSDLVVGYPPPDACEGAVDEGFYGNIPSCPLTSIGNDINNYQGCNPDTCEHCKYINVWIHRVEDICYELANSLELPSILVDKIKAFVGLRVDDPFSWVYENLEAKAIEVRSRYIGGCKFLVTIIDTR